LWVEILDDCFIHIGVSYRPVVVVGHSHGRGGRGWGRRGLAVLAEVGVVMVGEVLVMDVLVVEVEIVASLGNPLVLSISQITFL
jgi:hypothetical protein